MGEFQSKRRKRRRERGKGWKFWIVFVAVPVIFVLGLSTASYVVYIKRNSSGGRQGLEKGLIYAKLSRHSEAITEFKKELEKNPENANIHYHLGMSYIQLKEYDKAIAEFKTSLKMKPNFSLARLQLSNIDMTKAIELRKLGKSESLVLEMLLEAEKECREIIEKDPNFLQAYALLGEIHISQGLLDDAIIDYKRLLNYDNSFINGHLSLVKLYLLKKDMELAEKECNLILNELEPGNIQAQFFMSTIFQQKGKRDESVAFLKRILEQDPDNILAHTNLGLVYLELSKYDEALAEAETVFALPGKEKPAIVYFIKGGVLLQRKEYRKAITFLRDATLRLPKLVEPHYFLAIALTEAGRIEEAKTEFKKAVELAPEFIPAKMGLARLLSSAGWHKEAIDLCMDILKTDPDNVEARQVLGLAYVKLQDFDNAEKQFEKIVGLDSSLGDVNMAYLSLVSGRLSKCIRQCEDLLRTNPEKSKAAKVYEILGLAHLRRGNFENGIEQFKKGLEINPDSPSTLLNLAKAFLITAKNDEAKQTLRKVISIDTENVYARTLLAGIYKGEGDIDKAAKLLEQTIEINPDYIEGYTLANIYFLQGKTDASIDLYNKALKIDPENAVLLINLAISYQQKGNYDLSIQYGKKARDLKPDNPSFQLVLTNCYISNEEYSDAKDIVESIPSLSFDHKKAYLELLDLCQTNKEKGKQISSAINKVILMRLGGMFGLAIDECKKAVEIFPDNIVAKVILANTYLRLNRNEEAIAVYSEIIKEKPEFASSYYDLGRAYLLADKQDEAISLYQNMIDQDNKSVSARLALAGTLMKKGDAEKAGKLIEDVVKLDPENMVAHSMLGEVRLVDKDYVKAETEFMKMIELKRNSFEGHFNMARMKLAQGDFDKSIEHSRSALEVRPVDVRAHNILGVAYMRKGLLNDAVTEFNKIIDINADFLPAYLNLAQINIAGGKPEIAALLYKAALKINPDAVEARLGLGNAYALTGEHENATAECEAILEKYPNNTKAYISLARNYMALGKNSKALEAAMNAMSVEPNNLTARSILARVYVKKEEIQQAINQLNRVLPDNPNVLSLYELGILYVDIGDFNNAIVTYRQGVENFPDNSLLWCNLAVACQLNKDFRGEKDACSKALNIQPDGIIPNLCMMNMYLAKGEIENAKLHMKSMRNVNDTQKNRYLDLLELCSQNKELSDKVSYHFARALAYSTNRWFKRILKEYDEMAKLVPSNTVALHEQVDNLILMGENDRAIDVGKKIAEMEPESSDVHNKLAGLYFRKGENDKALAQYRRTISIDQDNFTAHLNMGIIMESLGMIEESARSYQKAIELNPASPVAYNNLAWLYASKMQGKMENALKLAEKAKELAPDNPAICDTLGWIYFKDGMYDKALSELKSAARNATWNSTIRYHLGMVYFSKGLQREALAEMERALKISNSFPEADKAKAVIEKIIIKRIKSEGKTVSMLQFDMPGLNSKVKSWFEKVCFVNMAGMGVKSRT